MSVGGIGSSSPYYGQIASGKALMSAADGASDLAISEGMNSQIRAYDQGTNNVGSGLDLTRIGDQALGNITDNLQRIRELGLASLNTATTTESDRASYQKEIDQLKQGIEDIAKQTSYNTKKLFDGSNQSFKLATDGNGGSASVTTSTATLDALGIKDLDVTSGNFDFNGIDKALEKVSSMRSQMGAESNGLEYQQDLNQGAVLNLSSADSRIEDVDVGKAMSKEKQRQLLDTVAMLMEKRRQEEEAREKENFFT